MMAILSRTEQYWFSCQAQHQGMKKPKKPSPRALLASLRKECSQPRMAESARAGYVKSTAMQIVTRRAFEAKPEWRATIKRRNCITFILEGKYQERFYECATDWIPRNRFGQIEMEGATLRFQLEAGQIELLKGTLLL
jgi:hypothetical protein